MKFKFALALTALVTASIVYAAFTYAGGSKRDSSDDGAVCCDPLAGPGQ